MNNQTAVIHTYLGLDHNNLDQYGAPTVNARDLHIFLESESRFNDWIARRIQEFGFEEGVDFYSEMSKSSGGRQAKDYHLTIDMAKELSMVERNDKGRSARLYFIECERELRQGAVNSIPQSRYLDLLEKNRELLIFQNETLKDQLANAPRRPRRVTDDDRQQIYKLFDEGHSFYRIGKMVDRDDTLVGRIIKRRKVA
ncbi:MAG: antA/AntB antirepressor family protein [Magnetococcales bacterium]|nr:antA/AntB antirepressor family protein [Magnetococcales bacterium]